MTTAVADFKREMRKRKGTRMFKRAGQHWITCNRCDGAKRQFSMRDGCWRCNGEGGWWGGDSLTV